MGLGEVVIELGKKKPGMMEDEDKERIDAAKAVAMALGVKLSDEKALALSDALEEHRACCDMMNEEDDEDE